MLNKSEKRNLDLGISPLFFKIIEFLQIASFISFYNTDRMNLVSLEDFLRAPILFARPTKLFTLYNSGYLSYPLAVVSIIIVLILIIIPIIAFLNRDKLDHQIKFLRMVEELYFSLLPILSVTIYILLMDIFDQVGVERHGLSIETQDINPIFAGICVLFLIIICLITFIILYYFETKLKIENKNLERNNNSWLHVSNHLL
jgi:hypothetical protein